MGNEWSENNPERMKELRRDWYERNKESEREKARVRQRELRKKNKEFLIELKSTTPCKDCGQQYEHYMMEFDHLPEFEKKGSPLNMIGTTSTMMAELDKCEIVCANCHSARTYKRRMDIA